MGLRICPGQGWFDYFPPPNIKPCCTGIGQTIIAPVSTPVLESYTFYATAPSWTYHLTAFVSSWNSQGQMYPDGSADFNSYDVVFGGTTGIPLYVSPTINASVGNTVTPLIITNTTGGLGLNLVPGQAYVLGLTVANPNETATDLVPPNNPPWSDIYRSDPQFDHDPTLLEYEDNYTHNPMGDLALQMLITGKSPSTDGGGGLVMEGLGDNWPTVVNGKWWDNYCDWSNGAGACTYPYQPGYPADTASWDMEFEATFDPVLTFDGTFSPGDQDLQFKELVYNMSDGNPAHDIRGWVALNDVCQAHETCHFLDAIPYQSPEGNVVTSVRYTILGFYGATGGPATHMDNGVELVDAANLFAIANGGYLSGSDPDHTFDHFWDPIMCFGEPNQVCGPWRTGNDEENQLALQLRDGLYGYAYPGSWDNMPSSGSTGGDIVNFSDSVGNGTFQMYAHSSEQTGVPEPAGTGMLAGLLLFLAWRSKAARR